MVKPKLVNHAAGDAQAADGGRRVPGDRHRRSLGCLLLPPRLQHGTHYTLLTTHYTLHTTHYTLHTSHYTLHPKHETSAPPTASATWYEQLLRRNLKRCRGGLVFKAHRLLYHSTLGSRVIKKKKALGRLLLTPRLQHGAHSKNPALTFLYVPCSLGGGSLTAIYV